METIKIKSSKGSISAAVHYPEMKTGKLAILCPGYLDSKDYRHLVGLAEVLCEKGYAVVRFDPTGTWESEGDISDYTVTQYLEDIKTVLDHMLGEAQYNWILLGGHSRGGQVSILYSARDPRISCVLGIMASSGKAGGQKREEWEKSGVRFSRRDLPDDKNVKREFVVPFSYVLDRDEYDTIGDVAKIKVPIVLIAGELDDVVPVESVKNIFDNANDPKRFLVIPGIGHDYRHSEDEVALVNGKILEQLDSFSV